MKEQFGNVDELEIEVGSRRAFKGWAAIAVKCIAISFSLFHLYTAYAGVLQPLQQRVVHLTFAMVLTLILFPMFRRQSSGVWLGIDISLSALVIASGVYLYLNAEEIPFRIGIVTRSDLVFGVITTLLLIEASRRLIGLSLPLIAAIFLLYAMVGPYCPGVIAHRGYSFGRIVTHTYLSLEGIFGIPLGVSATFVVLFIIFGAMLEASGGGQLIIEMANSAFGRMRGGPAKAAVVGSSLFGMISGSAVANVATVGSITIPLMKKNGYPPEFAAGIEAVASCGGQIMPPIMGATAFIIAEILGISYFTVALCAALPAVLYYVALFMFVHFAAVKYNLKRLEKAELVSFPKALFSGAHMLIPPIILIYFLGVMDYSVMSSAFWAIVSILIVSMFRRTSRMGLQRILLALEKGGMAILTVALACACAGIIVGVFSLTGLGMKLSTVLSDLSGNSLLALSFLTMIAAVILGTGLPTVPTYLILIILVAPAMIKMGVEPLAAHLFVFYYGALADLTPPTMITVYTAAAMAGTKNIGKTSAAAIRFSLAGWFLPFMFIYFPAFILKGPFLRIGQAFIMGVLSVTCMAAGLEGCYFYLKIKWLERLILLLASVMLGWPDLRSNLAGVVLLGLITLRQRLKYRAFKAGNIAPRITAD
jgi:TRAP transporter 4TM/12TM fusion protein